MEGQGDRWSDLAPELLENVVTRVEQIQGEARRVVAMAGVCRSWRRHILSMNSDKIHGSLPSSLVVLKFPKLLLVPGPCAPHPPMQCLIRRKGSHFALFQTPNRHDPEDKHFLLAARRRRLPTGFSYIIGKDPGSLRDKLSVNVLGKVKSNFWATEFVLWEKRFKEERDFIPVVSLTFVEHLVNGIRQRRIQGALQQSSGGGGGLEFVLEKRRRRGEKSIIPSLLTPWSACTCLSYGSCKGGNNTSRNMSSSSSRVTAATTNTAFPSSRTSITRQVTSVGFGADGVDVELRSKVPVWDAQQQCWSLDFKGRASMPSMHNFQLIRGEADASEDNIILQLGKIGKNAFNMDFCSPLSPFQAFSICLSSFATSAALEP